MSVKRPEGPRTASSTITTTMRTEDLVVALLLVRPGKGGGREGLPHRFSVDGICAERLGRLECRTLAITKAHMVAAV